MGLLFHSGTEINFILLLFKIRTRPAGRRGDLGKGNPPWIDATSVCVWLIFTIRIRSVWWVCLLVCFGWLCFLDQSLGVHSVALMVRRLSDSRSMLCFPDSVDVIASLLVGPGVSLSISKGNGLHYAIHLRLWDRKFIHRSVVQRPCPASMSLLVECTRRVSSCLSSFLPSGFSWCYPFYQIKGCPTKCDPLYNLRK